jgi:hypothetical protein
MINDKQTYPPRIAVIIRATVFHLAPPNANSSENVIQIARNAPDDKGGDEVLLAMTSARSDAKYTNDKRKCRGERHVNIGFIVVKMNSRPNKKPDSKPPTPPSNLQIVADFLRGGLKAL